MTMSEAVAGAAEQDAWNLVALISGCLVGVVLLFVAFYIVTLLLFSRTASPYWEIILAPALAGLRWLGSVLPKQGPWHRYVYQPRHLATAWP